MIDANENTVSPYAPPAVSSHAEEVPAGMVAVAHDRVLANYLKIRRQTPLTCLICLGTVGFWTSFTSILFGGSLLLIPLPALAVPLLSATAMFAAGALTAVPFTVLAAMRPQRRLAISAKGLTVLSAGFAVAVTIWVVADVLVDGIWDVSAGMLLWTAPLWFFLPHGMLSVWINRYGIRRLKEAGLSDRAIAHKSGEIYDFPR